MSADGVPKHVCFRHAGEYSPAGACLHGRSLPLISGEMSPNLGFMGTRETLLRRIAAYCEARSLSERQFGLKVTGDHKWIARLRRGQVSLSSIEKAEQFMLQPVLQPEPQPAEPEAAHPAGLLLVDAGQHAADQAARREPGTAPLRHPASTTEAA